MKDNPPRLRDMRSKDAREQELARALRENLKRRKAQAQARASQASTVGSPPKKR